MWRQTLLMVVLAAGAAAGQDESSKPAKPEAKYFHLDFAVKEVEAGKTLNARNYSMTVWTGPGLASVRSGSKVPLPTSKLTYVDIGTNIDCSNVQEVDGQLAFMVTAEVSSTAADASDLQAQVIRQAKWSSPVLVPLKKATVIFSSDDPASKRRMELEVTASPMGPGK